MKEYSFDDLKKIINTLVSENGCPWDKVQTHETLKPYLIEESYEVIDAVDNGNNKDICEELGDVLLQVFLHCAIAEKNGEFTLSDVVSGISEKMIRRHPHVFANTSANTSDEVLKNWDEIKKEEKQYESGTDILKRIPKSLPAIMRSQKVQEKAAKLGFDNRTVDKILCDMQTSLDTLKSYKNLSEMSKITEIGKFISDIIKFSQFFKINTEISLTNATEKFINRFEDFENKKMN